MCVPDINVNVRNASKAPELQGGSHLTYWLI